jgi:peptidoglycan glycosyltransferase
MQTSLARRQRRRRKGAARRPHGGGVAQGVALAVPILLLSSFVAVGLVSFVGVVSAYAYFSRDLPEPRALLTDLEFDQQTLVYDRTGGVELARLGQLRREVVTFAEIPGEILDATTAIEDKDFWTNPGFDLAGFVSAGLDTIAGRPRGGSTITQQLVRARLLPEDAFEGSVYERKIREIIQSIRLTDAYPGDQGKQDIITAYLNQNFYGNQSYGVKAAARAYFDKDLADLTLAEAAILAAIPQSPTAFDLVRNATEVCGVEVADEEACPAGERQLVVPADTDIVIRRNHILDLMKTRSPLSGDRHTTREYDLAKLDPVVLAPQGRQPWKAPHFVWQVREELAGILCVDLPADSCEAVDTGGYRVITALDWGMQQVAEKWTFAAARSPNLGDPRASLRQLGIPESEWSWILGLRERNIHNAATGVIDYRTGEVLAYVGSASYTSPGTAKFQPQFDVLSTGWRQPGSAIKPINYVIGIDDGTMTAATLLMDVVTDFGTGGREFTPTQADGLERGPVRLRSALQFSLNVPAIKAGLINGLDRFYQRSADFGIRYVPGSVPVTSMSIGTLELHPIDLLRAYGAIADGGVLMPQQKILQVFDADGNEVWPAAEGEPAGTRVTSAAASYIVTDILAGNTVPSTNPYWAEWRIVDGGNRRPAAYKTGTTSDNRDVLAMGYIAPPEDPLAPALAVGVWMGNSNNEPNRGSLSLDSSAPLWSAIMTEISAGLPIANFKPPAGLVQAEVDAFSGLRPGPYTTRTVTELFVEGTVPKSQDDLHVELAIDATTGLLWQDGCVGPMEMGGFVDFSLAEPAFPQWKPFTLGWAERAARGTGVRGGPEGTRTTYFYNGAFAPLGRSWGGAFAPTEICPLAPTPEPCVDDPFEPPGTPIPEITPEPTPCITFPPFVTFPPDDGPGGGPGGGPRPKPTKPPD